MAKFTVHTAVHGERGTVFFGPGDEVPQWAASKVGAHVTDADESDVDETAETETDDESATEPTTDSSEAPDFTAPKRTRTPRRK